MTLEFTVADMICGHCVKTITNAVQSTVSGAQVSTNLDTYRILVTGTDRAEVVVATIRDAGYEPVKS